MTGDDLYRALLGERFDVTTLAPTTTVGASAAAQHDRDRRHDRDDIARLAAHHWTAHQIAATTGIPRWRVEREMGRLADVQARQARADQEQQRGQEAA